MKTALPLFILLYFCSFFASATKQDHSLRGQIQQDLEDFLKEENSNDDNSSEDDLFNQDSSSDDDLKFYTSEDEDSDEFSSWTDSDTCSIISYYYPYDNEFSEEQDKETPADYICDPKEYGACTHITKQKSKKIADARNRITLSLHAIEKEMNELKNQKGSRRYKKLFRLHNNFLWKLEQLESQKVIKACTTNEPLIVPKTNPDQQRIHINHRQVWSGDFGKKNNINKPTKKRKLQQIRKKPAKDNTLKILTTHNTLPLELCMGSLCQSMW